MRNKRMATNMKMVLAVVPVPGEPATLTSIEVAGAGYDRAMYIVQTGAQTATATLDVKVQEAAATGMGGATDISGGALTQLAASSGSKIYIIDVPVNPAKTFQKTVAVMGTEDMPVSILCILYCGKDYPVATTYATQLVTVA